MIQSLGASCWKQPWFSQQWNWFIKVCTLVLNTQDLGSLVLNLTTRINPNPRRFKFIFRIQNQFLTKPSCRKALGLLNLEPTIDISPDSRVELIAQLIRILCLRFPLVINHTWRACRFYLYVASLLLLLKLFDNQSGLLWFQKLEFVQLYKKLVISNFF